MPINEIKPLDVLPEKINVFITGEEKETTVFCARQGSTTKKTSGRNRSKRPMVGKAIF